MWCVKCNARILTVEEMETGTGMCIKCQKLHAVEFHEKYDIERRDENGNINT